MCPCSAIECKWKSSYTVEAKRGKKTLDFECWLTEDSHMASMAILFDLSCYLPRRIEYDLKINLFMAIPGVRSAPPFEHDNGDIVKQFCYLWIVRHIWHEV